jgi:hypothetical protein
MALDRRFLNVIILGFAFMFVFTAFQTMGNIEVRRTVYSLKLHPTYVTTVGFIMR